MPAIDATHLLLLTGALLMFAAILLGAASSRLGVPFLLVFLVVGMVSGEDGPGGIEFDDFELGFLVGNLALAVILLDGGVRTKLTTFRVALAPSLTLASGGVVVSAALTGFAAWLLFDWDWRVALLLGAIVGSTDAAAVFSMLRSSRLRLNERVAATLEIESGANDPMAVFLTIALIELVMEPQRALSFGLLGDLLSQFGIGAATGVALGWLLGAVLRRVALGEGLYALVLCSGGVAIFAGTNWLGGSGFLAVYLTGLTIGNLRQHAGDGALRVLDGLAWLSQSGMFLLLGLLVTPRELGDVLWPALALAVFLMLIARPLAVWVCLLPFRFPRREQLFVGWVGLRGAVPIVLGMFPLLAGVPQARELFDVAFVVVLASLLVQGSTVALAARATAVTLPPRQEPLMRVQVGAATNEPMELAQFAIRAGTALAGQVGASVSMPGESRLVSVLRQGSNLEPQAAGTLRAGDRILLLGTESAIERAADWLGTTDTAASASRRAAFGEFILDARAPAASLLDVYGVDTRDVQGMTLEDLLLQRLGKAPVPGDSVSLGQVRLTVVETARGRIVRIGLALPH